MGGEGPHVKPLFAAICHSLPCLGCVEGARGGLGKIWCQTRLFVLKLGDELVSCAVFALLPSSACFEVRTVHNCLAARLAVCPGKGMEGVRWWHCWDRMWEGRVTEGLHGASSDLHPVMRCELRDDELCDEALQPPPQ